MIEHPSTPSTSDNYRPTESSSPHVVTHINAQTFTGGFSLKREPSVKTEGRCLWRNDKPVTSTRDLSDELNKDPSVKFLLLESSVSNIVKHRDRSRMLHSVSPLSVYICMPYILLCHLVSYVFLYSIPKPFSLISSLVCESPIRTVSPPNILAFYCSQYWPGDPWCIWQQLPLK